MLEKKYALLKHIYICLLLGALCLFTAACQNVSDSNTSLHSDSSHTQINTPLRIDDNTAPLSEPQTKAVEASQEKVTPSEVKSVRINAVGDMMFARYIGQKIESSDGTLPFRKVKHLFKEDEINIANLENPLFEFDPPKQKSIPINEERASTSTSEESSSATKPVEPIVLCGNPKAIEGLRYANISCVSLANNHAMDKGQAGLKKTLELLDTNKILHSGAGLTASDAHKAAIITHNGINISYISASNIIPAGYLASKNSAGIAGARTRQNQLIQQVKQAKASGHVVLVALHWGNEYQETPLDKDRKFAHQLIDAGADALICHHPHVLQGVEIYQNKPILYSLGNFIFDIYHSHADESLVAHLDLSETGEMKSLSFTPIRIKGGIPSQAHGEDAQNILNRFNLLSKEMGTQLEIKDEHSVLIQQ